MNSCGDIEGGTHRVRGKFAVSHPVEVNFLRCGLNSQDGLLPRITIQEDIQFRNLGNSATVRFPVQLNRELHAQSLPANEPD